MSKVMDGDPVAIRQSQELARARYALTHREESCPTILAGNGGHNSTAPAPKKKWSDPSLADKFLNALSSRYFSRWRLIPSTTDDMNAVLPSLAQQPELALNAFLLDEQELRRQFPEDPSVSLADSFAKTGAMAFGNFLKVLRLKDPALLDNFERILTGKVMGVHDNTMDLFECPPCHDRSASCTPGQLALCR